MVCFALFAIGATIMSGAGRPGVPAAIAIGTVVVVVASNLMLPAHGRASASTRCSPRPPARALGMAVSMVAIAIAVHARFGVFVAPASGAAHRRRGRRGVDGRARAAEQQRAARAARADRRRRRLRAGLADHPRTRPLGLPGARQDRAPALTRSTARAGDAARFGSGSPPVSMWPTRTPQSCAIDAPG